MGCKLVRGETIYFVRHAGPTAGPIASPWLGDDRDLLLLPRVYTHSNGRQPHPGNSVVPIEVQCFDPA